MKLSSLVDPALVLARVSVSGRDEAVDLALGRLQKEYRLGIPRDEILAKLVGKDALGGGVMPSGLAVLHVRLDGFEDLVISICVPETPFDSDGVKVRMLALIVSGTAKAALYLNTLAALVATSRNEAVFSELIAQRDADSFLETLRRNDRPVKKELSVADIMSREVASVTPETTIRELVDLFSRRQFSYAPVVDAEGRFVGEVNIRDTLRLGIPEYATMVGSLKFLSTFEPLEGLLRDEARLKVSQIMKKPSLVFEPDTSIIEAVLVISQNRRRHVAVVRDGRVEGIVSVMDILNKVLRG